jgi:hypothetical protein
MRCASVMPIAEADDYYMTGSWASGLGLFGYNVWGGLRASATLTLNKQSVRTGSTPGSFPRSTSANERGARDFQPLPTVSGRSRRLLSRAPGTR